jgi:hypothetical protein
MVRQPVKSSHVASLGHGPEGLEVEYTSGKVYVMPDVTAEHFAELLKAPSIGRALNELKKQPHGQTAHRVDLEKDEQPF